jgi:hypothetical protein
VLALDDEAFLRTLPPDLQVFARPMVEVDREGMARAYLVLGRRRVKSIDVDELYRETARQAAREPAGQQASFAEHMRRIKPYCQRWYAGWDDLDYRPFYPLNSAV